MQYRNRFSMFFHANLEKVSNKKVSQHVVPINEKCGFHRKNVKYILHVKLLETCKLVGIIACLLRSLVDIDF